MVKLSKLQRHILAFVAEQHAAGGEPGYYGWSRWGTTGLTRSEQAAYSRALKRLQQRGLIERRNYMGDGPRTTHVKVTMLGVELTEAVNKTGNRNVNRFTPEPVVVAARGAA